MWKKVVITLLLVGFLSTLVITNPPESRYLAKIAADYGSGHTGSMMAIEQLQELGSGERTSYGLFSTYRYEFGNVGVSYLGIATYVIQINSYSREILKKQENRQA